MIVAIAVAVAAVGFLGTWSAFGTWLGDTASAARSRWLRWRHARRCLWCRTGVGE